MRVPERPGRLLLEGHLANPFSDGLAHPTIRAPSMTLDTISFSLTAPATGRLLGVGLIAPGSRYASVRWIGFDWIDRRPVSRYDWIAIRCELALGLRPGPLLPPNVLHRALAGIHWRDVIVQCVHRRPIEIDRPEQAAERLDARLLQLTAPPPAPEQPPHTGRSPSADEI
jgi:hypothetical protein